MTRIALATLALVASLGSAQAYDRVDARQASEARRIEEGRRTGQLSGREYNALKAEQARIAADERRAKADGYVSPQERAKLNRELDVASAHIRELKHNNEVAGGRRHHWYSRWW
jgi:uncharacterized membrane protein YebE (DUF533 family)